MQDVSFQEQAITVVFGVQAIKNMGGIAIAQDEATADFYDRKINYTFFILFPDSTPLTLILPNH